MRLLEAISPDAPVRLVGHSMGANVGGSLCRDISRSACGHSSMSRVSVSLTATPRCAATLSSLDRGSLRHASSFSSYADIAYWRIASVRRNPAMARAKRTFVAREWAARRQRRRGPAARGSAAQAAQPGPLPTCRGRGLLACGNGRYAAGHRRQSRFAQRFAGHYESRAVSRNADGGH